MTFLSLLAFLGLGLLGLGFFWPRGVWLGGGVYLLTALLGALAQGPLTSPAQVALLLGGLLALRAGTLLLRPRLALLRRYLLLLALLLGLFALRALPHPGGPLPVGLTLLHAGAFLVGYLALAVGVGAGVLSALQDRYLRTAPEKALNAPPLWSLRRLERAYVHVGFVAVTLGLGSGMAWAFGYFGTPLSLDPKELSVLLGWVLLALYLALEEGFGERARVSLLLLAYAALLFAFLGAPFLGSRHPSGLGF